MNAVKLLFLRFLSVVLLFILAGCGPIIGMNRNMEFKPKNVVENSSPLEVEKSVLNSVSKVAIVDPFKLFDGDVEISQTSKKTRSLISHYLYDELKKSNLFDELVTPYKFTRKYKEMEGDEDISLMSDYEVDESIGRVAKAMGCDAAIYYYEDEVEDVKMSGAFVEFILAGTVSVEYVQHLKFVGGNINEGSTLYSQGIGTRYTTNGAVDVLTDNQIIQAYKPMLDRLINDFKNQYK